MATFPRWAIHPMLRDQDKGLLSSNRLGIWDWRIHTAVFIYFFPFIFIRWRLVTLQYFSGFCHTLTWISHGFTCVPHPDPPPASLSIPSLWVFPVHQPWAPISCIQPGLVICFTLDSILVSLHWNKSWVLKSSFVWFFLHSAACSS